MNSDVKEIERSVFNATHREESAVDGVDDAGRDGDPFLVFSRSASR